VSLSRHFSHKHHGFGQITRIVALQREGRQHERLTRAAQSFATQLNRTQLNIGTAQCLAGFRSVAAKSSVPPGSK